jgi:hypothetical protein
VTDFFSRRQTLRLGHTAFVILCLCAWAARAEGQSRMELPPQGALSVTCLLDSAAYTRGTIYVDGRRIGSCPGVARRFNVGTHSVRVGEALGENRYLVYENEGVEVRRDETRKVTATLKPGMREQSPSLAFALGVKRLSSIPRVDDFDAAAFSPDLSVVAVNAETNSVLLYDAASGKLLRRLGERGEYWVSFVNALSFSADGSLLASDGWLPSALTGEINVWDVKSGRLLRNIPRVKKVTALALSPDGGLLAAGIAPNAIKLWNVADGKLLWDIRPSSKADDMVSTLLFSADGRALVSKHGAEDNIHVYDALTAGHARALPGRLVNLAADGSVSTYLFRDGFTVRNTWQSLTGGPAESRRVKFPASEFMCASVVARGSELWSVRDEQLMVNLPGNYALALSADGRRLLMYGDGEDGGYVVWSLPAP